MTSESARSALRYRRIAFSGATSLVARISSAVLAVLSVPLLLHHLGKNDFGLWNAALALGAWITVLDLGFGTGLTNCLAAETGRGDLERVRKYVATALFATCSVALAAFAVLLLVYPLVDWGGLIGVSGGSGAASIRPLVFAALAAGLVGLPFSLATGIYAGLQLTFVSNLFFVAGQAAAFGVLVVGSRSGWMMPTLLFWFCVAQSAGTGVALAYGFRGPLRSIRPRFVDFSWGILLDLVRRSAPLFLYQVGAALVTQTQVLVIAHRLSLEAVSEYSVLARLLTLVASLIFVSTASFMPPIREAFERGERGWARKAFSRLLRIRLAAALGSAAILLLGGTAIVETWTGSKDLLHASAVWLPMALLLVISAWVTSWTDLSTVMDRTWRLVPLVLTNGFVTLGLTWLAAASYGVAGVFLATSAVSLFLLSWVMPLLTRSALADRKPSFSEPAGGLG